eukprot:TRINITY_DN12814_c0_g3_i1.p1 TRINITY_DN12814_c0_g3~~TRINITY_DN12814_c0_g3_i1.p1  ORF type:complete len:173 (+),score=35.02 TRINITY_DN12814_c0_g3_i1:281-799(+)
MATRKRKRTTATTPTRFIWPWDCSYFAVETYDEVGPNWAAILNKLHAEEGNRKWDLDKLVKPLQVKTHIQSLYSKTSANGWMYKDDKLSISRENKKNMSPLQITNLERVHAREQLRLKKEWEQVKQWLQTGFEKETSTMNTESQQTVSDIDKRIREDASGRKGTREEKNETC